MTIKDDNGHQHQEGRTDMPSKLLLYHFRNRILACALLFIASSSATAAPTRLPTDKAAHFGLSSVAVEATMKSCQALEKSAELTPACRLWSSGIVLTAGLLKEASDQRRGGKFDGQDVIANVLGVATGNLLQWNF
jgi:uncharacterized protein YfiM (DUF2279 family)